MTAEQPVAGSIAFDNSYARLPDRFYARLAPTPVAMPRLVKLNVALARHLGLDAEALERPDGVAILAGNRVPQGADPLAQAYAGHQFGGFVPQLGDGRAILLGEVVDRDGVRRDIQLKGSGPTPYSRNGDGRAALGPVLREYVVAEAMAALDVPTTRALAAVTTGEHVYRETALPGAVLTRVARSHIRVGTFQFFAARGDIDGVRTLADYVIARHYPAAAEAANPYRALLEAVVARQADLVAQWLALGFIHGVMNTDNMSIAGETIDYGPCAFMDTYHPGTVYSSIDQMGRYAFGNQPRMAQWNLSRLAETLLVLISPDEETALAQGRAALGTFAGQFQAAYAKRLGRKLGLSTAQEGDDALARALLDVMTEQSADYTLVFRRLADCAESEAADAALRAAFADAAAIDSWLERWRQRIGAEACRPRDRAAGMRAASPIYIPRNHLVEEVIAAAVSRGDHAPFARLVEVLSRPFDEQAGAERYALPPRPEEVVLQTFCGT